MHDAVVLPAAVEAALVAHARRAAPRECCGLLLGRGDGGVIAEAVATHNGAAQPERAYLIEPHEHLRVIRDARRRGLRIVGAYHSHPHSPSRPSATDTREGFSDFLFVIVGLAGAHPDVSAWQWEAGNFTAVPLVRTAEGLA